MFRPRSNPYHIFVLVCTMVMVTLHAYEPQITCYQCFGCGNNYDHSAIKCDARHFFCVFVKFANQSVDRFCGDMGNCTLYTSSGTFCSMCSADYCNDMHRGNQIRYSAPMTLATLLIGVCFFAA